MKNLNNIYAGIMVVIFTLINIPSSLAAESAPNIILIMLDDMGFGDTSTFGGAAETPVLDKLAREGLRYNNFHTTAVCSPTRAALLTGRNHHRVGFGDNPELAAAYPGYDAIWKKDTASIAEILRQNGYSTAAFGKWHNTPNAEISPAGPFDRWPTGLGFEYFYGFHHGSVNQWEPAMLYRNTRPADPSATPEQGYHFTTDMTNEAIGWLNAHEALTTNKPYFLYFATGAVHSPHHAPKEWIEKYRGKFDQGWDKLREEIFARQKKRGVIPESTELTPRPEQIPAWDGLSADQKKLYARQMEVYAGFISHTDSEVGRLLETVRNGPDADNTLILFIVGDNGASTSGGTGGRASGATTFDEKFQLIDEIGSASVPRNEYAIGWAWAGSSPFQWWKKVASHFGGTRNPLVVSWPARIKDRGGLRSQFTHVNDIAGTLYDVVGIPFPSAVNGVKQQALDGASFAKTFHDAGSPVKHVTQYFETHGNRAIYHDGWVAAARSFYMGNKNRADDVWELYHVAEDFSQARDLAAQYPKKLKKLQELFDKEAYANDVYPLDAPSMVKHPALPSKNGAFVYPPNEYRFPQSLLPFFGYVSYRLKTTVTVPPTGAEGIIASYGDRVNGFVLYMKDGHVVYENRAGKHHDKIVSEQPLPSGDATITFEFERDSEQNTPLFSAGTGRLYINGELSAAQNLPFVQLTPYLTALFIGHTYRVTVSNDITLPFPFTGAVKDVKVELDEFH